MNGLLDLWNSVYANLLSEFIIVVAGILFAQFVRRRFEQWRFGNWRVIVKKQGEVLVDRAISPRKAHEIAEETADLSVYLKGLVSPYDWIKSDLIEDGEKLGLLTIDKENRRYIIDLDKNQATTPSSTSASATR